ncbi:MAG: PAS domain S-box protein [Nitrospirae bacterium]|nr:PAS domain S-box protein [Nitrospirota bacterium]
MKLWSRLHSLQRKIIAAIVMVGLLPLTFSLILTYVEERRALRDTIGANFKELAVGAASRVEMQVTRVISEARQLASTPFLRTAATEANRSYAGKDEPGIQSMIKDWQQRWRERERRSEFPIFINRIVTNHLIRWHDIRRADYVGIFVTDSRGALVVSSIPQVEYFYGKTAWWQAVFNGGRGQPYVSDLYFDPSFGAHVLNVSVPILEEDQRTVVGVVTILLRRDMLFQSISAVTIGATGHAMLMTSDGTPMICPVLAPEGHAITPALVREVTLPKAGWVVVPEDSHGGRNSIVGFSPVRLGDQLAPGSLEGKRWVALVRQDPAETFAPLNQLLGKVAAYGVLVFAVLWGTGTVVARRLARPIQVLHEGAQRIGAGSLDHQVTVQTGDEIEQLAVAFNGMAANLKQSFGQLERRMAEIRRLEEKYRDLIENSPEMIHQLNKAGQFVHVNKTELEKLGYSLEDMLGMRLWDIVPKGKEPEILAYLEQLMAQGRGTIETVFLTRDGQPIDVEIHATALFDIEGGGLVYSRAFVRDVTQRKLLEQKVQRYTAQLEEEVLKVRERTREIEETKNYLENLLENANDVIYTLDADQRFTYVNSKVATWGYRKEDLIGRPYLSLLSKRHRGRRLKSTLDIGAKQVYEVEVMSRTGEARAVMVSVSPLRDAEDRVLGVMGIARDITETKKLERQIRNSEKLASIGKLGAGVAHEINNPLGGILNCLYNLRKGTLPPARQEEYLASMEDGLRRVQKIVRQLLEFSQQHEPELSLTDINGVIERVLVLTDHALVANRIRLEKRLQPDLPAVMADRHMMEQVLMNLILNAIQAIKGGGGITISTRVEEGACAIDVQDTGCGIPSQLLSRIFDPFFTTKGVGEGTGLGLSVSLGIVERHGGRILVESEAGKGATFTVCLPLSRDRATVGRAS